MSQKIKLPSPGPCPFCGRPKGLSFMTDAYSGHYYVRCRECLANGPLDPDPVAAVTRWNTRPKPEEGGGG